MLKTAFAFYRAYALLAGLPNAPSAYAPDSEIAEKRTEIVLENMSECG